MDSRLVLAILIITFTASYSTVNANSGTLINKKVDRSIDLTSQLAKITTKVHVENGGKEPVSTYSLTLDPSHGQSLSFISVSLVVDKEKNQLRVTKVDENNWTVHLADNSISPGVTKQLEIIQVFTHLLTPHPKEISQSERQLVIYNGNHYFKSPYKTVEQSTKIRIPPSATIESVTKLKPSTHSGSNLDFGPYNDVAPNSVSELVLHFENNTPFLTVTSYERVIELSHWAGVISIEEQIELVHTGASLKGAFSRYEFQREQNSGLSAVKSFRTKLPKTAFDVYYRDSIGNISTSGLRKTQSNLVAELRPRFPLFGGWKTNYILGYSLPASEYLLNDGNQFVLRLPFIGHIFDNSVIDQATVRVVLPEGAGDIKLRLPFTIQRLKDEVKKTYLDTFGRTVVVLKKENLVENHKQDFEVHYTFNRLMMLQEPLLIVSFLFILCVLVIIYARLDFSLTRDPLKGTIGKVATVLESIIRKQESRVTSYQLYDSAITKFKTNKDTAAFQSTLKRLNGELKQDTQVIDELVKRIRETASSELLEKIGELQRFDKVLREKLQEHSNLVEKLTLGKMQKQPYIEAEKKLQQAKEELAEKLRTLTLWLSTSAATW